MVEHLVKPDLLEKEPEEPSEFFYNYELKEENKDGIEYINEFKKIRKVGEGAFSKVYRVERSLPNEDTGVMEVDYFAMKMLNKSVLKGQ